MTLPGKQLRIALIGAGRIGSSHARLITEQVHRAAITTVVDPVPGAADALADALGVPTRHTEVSAALADPEVDAVLIAAPARQHTELVVAAAGAGKHVFCEKPMATTLEDADRAIAAADQAGVVLQVGFNRRFAPGFAALRAAVDAGTLGTPQLLRSLTRDPGPWGGDPSRVPEGTIFYETLIHDFDTLLWLNPGAEPVAVHTFADALVRPDARKEGFYDTAVVSIRFSGGAIAVAEANFSALYGYDVRGEVFGSAGMGTAGNGRTSDLTLFVADGARVDTARRDTDLLRDAYVGEFRAFADACLDGLPSPVPGTDARRALQVALAARESAATGAVVTL